jgi:VCBS repeat-containing protein
LIKTKASFNKTSKSFHFFYLLIGIGALLLILSPKANANEANCYSSKNSDQKNFCLATAKHQGSYCYSIHESDTKICVLHRSKVRSVTVTASNQAIKKINAWP